jgi:hypothetical protein
MFLPFCQWTTVAAAGHWIFIYMLVLHFKCQVSSKVTQLC